MHETTYTLAYSFSHLAYVLRTRTDAAECVVELVQFRHSRRIQVQRRSRRRSLRWLWARAPNAFLLVRARAGRGNNFRSDSRRALTMTRSASRGFRLLLLSERSGNGSARPRAELWTRFGRALGTLLEGVASALGAPWERFGSALGTLWESSAGNALGKL